MFRLAGILLLSIWSFGLLAQADGLSSGSGMVSPFQWSTSKLVSDTLPPAGSYPVLAADGNTLYFSLADHPRNLGFADVEDIWHCQKEADVWQSPFHTGVAINTTAKDRLIGIDVSGTSMFLYPGNAPRLFVSQRRGRSWTTPREMTIAGLEEWPAGAKATIGPHASLLVLSLPVAADSSQYDLFLSRRQSEWVWGPPVTLGTTINTDANEWACWLGADMTSLYFASDRAGGAGGVDLYFSQRLDNSWTNWSPPVNLGPTINTDQDETQLTVSAAGTTAVMVRETNASQELFTLELPTDFRPKPVTLVRVQLRGTTFPPYLELYAANPSLPKAYLYPDRTGRLSYIAPMGAQPTLRSRQSDVLPVALNALPDPTQEADQPETALLTSLQADVDYQIREQQIIRQQAQLSSMDQYLAERHTGSNQQLDSLRRWLSTATQNEATQDTLVSQIPTDFYANEPAGDKELDRLRAQYQEQFGKKQEGGLPKQDTVSEPFLWPEYASEPGTLVIPGDWYDHWYAVERNAIVGQYGEKDQAVLVEKEAQLRQQIKNSFTGVHTAQWRAKDGEKADWQADLVKDIPAQAKKPASESILTLYRSALREEIKWQTRLMLRDILRHNLESSITQQIEREKLWAEKDSNIIAADATKPPALQYEERELIVALTAFRPGASFPVSGIRFSPNTATIKPSSFSNLEALAEQMNQFKNYRFTISGHTNTYLSHQQAMALSTRRAKAVYDFLIEEGVPAEQLKYEGLGKTRPHVQKTSEYTSNQRITISIHHG